MRLMPVDEPDQKALVVVARLLLDADHTHLVQVDDGQKVAAGLVAPQLKESRDREVSVVNWRWPQPVDPAGVDDGAGRLSPA